MTVGELRKALRGLPADMPIACNETHTTSGLSVAVMRYHFSAPIGKVRYCDGLWITWSGSYQFLTLHQDGRVVNERSGYKPELQRVLHDDVYGESRWPQTEIERVTP